MASADSMSLSGLLECNICMEELSEDNVPRALPCSHVYCTTCLSKLVRDHRGKIKCPDCRAEHIIINVEELNVSRPIMQLRELKHTQQRKREAESQKQKSDGSDSASTASESSASEIEGRLNSLKALMWEASQSGNRLEKAINETQERRGTLSHTKQTAKQTIEDEMDRIVRAANERRQQLHQILEDKVQKSMSWLSDIEKDFKAKQESHERFCSKMAEMANKTDPEEIDLLIKETQDRIKTYENMIPIPMKEISLDTDDDRYQSILEDVSSWGGIKTKDITHKVQHYHAKTKATRTIDSRTDTDLKNPQCVAQLPNGDIAIGSSNSIQIRVYDSDLKPKTVFSLPSGERSVRSSGLTGMCVTPNGKLCISDPFMKTVHVVTPEGRLESSFNTCLYPREKGFYPRGLASNKEGEVFVCDWNNHVIRVFDQSGQECRRFGGRGEEPGKLCNPWDLAVTPDGKVLVADFGNHRIQVFVGTGRYQATFGSQGSAPNQLANPAGIAIDSMGFVAVVEFANHRVQLFTPGWESFHVIHNQEDPFGYPQSIIFRKQNKIVVCDSDHDRIQLF